MTVTRRHFLQTNLAFAAASVVPLAFASSIQDYTLFSAWQRERSYGAGVPNALARSVELVTRGHHIEIINEHEVWLFARRPSSYMLRVNWRTGQVLARYIYDSDRTGFGHGVMRADGLLLTTDQRLDDDSGLLTLRDGRSGQVIQEFLSGGVGPHELLMLPDGIHVAIANGGILTRPDSGRIKLNLKQIKSNLCVINSQTGELVQRAELDDKRLSIRHLAHLPEHSIGIALQFEPDNEKAISSPVAAHWHPTKGLNVLNAPFHILERAKGYAASAAGDAHTYFAVSCPNANAVLIWDAQGQWMQTLDVPSAYGLAAMPETQSLAVSSENGGIYYFDTQTWQERTSQRQMFDVKWDNHLIAWKGN